MDQQNMQQPSNQPPPQQNYQPQPPPMQPQQQPQQPMRPAGGGLSAYIGANVQASPVERTTIMLLRLIAWIALIVLVIALCGDFFDVILNAGRTTDTFRNLLNGFITLLRNFALGAVTAAGLLALASIVESLIVIRRNGR